MLYPINPLITFDDFYQKKPPSSNCISELTKEEIEQALILLFGLNSIDNVSLTHPYIVTIFRNLSSEQKITLSRYFAKGSTYLLYSHRSINNLITNLLNAIQKASSDKSKVNTPIVQILFDLILLHNGSQHRESGVGHAEDSHRTIWELLLMQDINGYNNASYSRTGILKQLIFNKFLKSELDNEFINLEKDWFNKTGLNSLLDYIRFFVDLKLQNEKTNKSSAPVLTFLSSNPSYNLIHSLELLIDTSKNMPIETSILVMKPFIKLSGEEIYLNGTHDFSLITNKGLEYFLQKNELLSKYLPAITDIKSLLAYLGKEYIENYLLKNLFNSIVKKGIRVVPTDDKKLPDITLIINEKDVYLFEIKSSSLNYRVMCKENIEDLITFLEDNFIGKKKGVTQLIKNVETLALEKEALYNIRTPLKNLILYPIIIYTEPHLSKHGINDYINLNAPKIAEGTSSAFKHIMPTTLIHYDFFIDNYLQLNSDRTFLKTLIRGYHQEIKKNKKRYIKINSTNQYLNSIISFDDFVALKRLAYTTPRNIIFDQVSTIFQLKN